jgi:hypothetical protein
VAYCFARARKYQGQLIKIIDKHPLEFGFLGNGLYLNTDKNTPIEY